MTVSSVQIGYGTEAKGMTTLSELLDQLPKRFEGGDLWVSSVLRDELIKAAKEKDVAQGYYRRLWVAVRGSGGRYVYRAVRIEPDIVRGNRFEPAMPYITSDLFLGFSALKPRIHSRGEVLIK